MTCDICKNGSEETVTICLSHIGDFLERIEDLEAEVKQLRDERKAAK